MDQKPIRDLARLLCGDPVEREPARPLLAMLVEVTGLQCVYLAQVDEARNRFSVVLSQATDPHGVVLPEGTEIPWSETLCKSVFDAGLNHVRDAEPLWPANENVRALGIRTYLGQPIRDRGGAVVGTLCAASREQKPVPETATALLELFTRLLALQIEQDRAVRTAHAAFADDSARAIAAAMDRTPDKEDLEQKLRRAFRLHPWDQRSGCAAEASGRAA